jgi:putative endonuclease
MFVYLLKCADGSFYVGSTRATLDRRVPEHSSGAFGGYTLRRRPVQLVWSQEFAQVVDGVAAERQIKGWSRAKKEALIEGDFDRIRLLSRRGAKAASSFETRLSGAPQDKAKPRRGLKEVASSFETRRSGAPRDEAKSGQGQKEIES